VSAAELQLGRDGHGLDLVPRTLGRAELEQLLHAHDPTLRLRRVGGRLNIEWSEAEKLADDAPEELEWTPEAARALENRRSVREAAVAVLDEARQLVSGGVQAARSAIGDSDLVGQLDDHQVVNVALMTILDGWGTCVFDEQGTGKTLTVICAFDILAERNEADVLVVVAPKSMVKEWAVEFGRFASDLYRVAVADGSRREKATALRQGADVVVLNYEAVVSLQEDLRLLARRCRVVLAIDESYNVKNPDARRTAAVAELREWCTRCFVLCGTPAPNSPVDLISQFDVVDFGYTFDGIREMDVIGEPQLIRDAITARGLYTRHLKDAVLPDLPRKQFNELMLDLSGEQRRLYAAALDRLVDDLEHTDDVTFRRQLVSFLERRNMLLRICSNPAGVAPNYAELPAKLVALDELLPRYLADGEKVVIWSFFRVSLERLARRYAPLGLVRVDGSVDDAGARREAVRKFQEDDETMIFLGNPAAAGAGLTLHRARIAIYESFSNQAAHFMQSLDRIHRRGQGRPVEYFALLCRGTLEEIEYQRILDKTDAQADLLGDPTPERPTRQLMLAELLDAQTRFAETA
jgi:SNF2 family DNA or RNA helicase